MYGSTAMLLEYGKAKKFCKQLAKTWHADKVSKGCAGVAGAVFHATQTVCKYGLDDKDDKESVHKYPGIPWKKELRDSDVVSVLKKEGFGEAVAAAEKVLGKHGKK